MTNEQVIEMGKMRMNGYSLQDIGEKYGITKQRVHQLLRLIGTDYAFGSRRSKVGVYEKIAYPVICEEMKNAGMTLSGLAREAGVPYTTVVNILYGETQGSISACRKIVKALGLEGSMYSAFEIDGEQNGA